MNARIRAMREWIRRLAGATRSDVLAPVLREGLRSVGIGLVVGLAAVFSVSRLIGSLLFGIQPTDLTTVGIVCATMMLVAVAAAGVPAWRASRLDPARVLRAE